MDRDSDGIPSSRLKEFERDSLLFHSVFQNIVASDNEDNSSILDIPKNQYLFLNGLAKKNSRTRRISFWSFRSWRTARDIIGTFLSTSDTGIFGLCETFLDEFSIESVHELKVLMKDQLKVLMGINCFMLGGVCKRKVVLVF